jgi:hypothetical protein
MLNNHFKPIRMNIENDIDTETNVNPVVDVLFIVNRIAVAIVLCCLILLLIKFL